MDVQCPLPGALGLTGLIFNPVNRVDPRQPLSSADQLVAFLRPRQELVPVCAYDVSSSDT